MHCLLWAPFMLFGHDYGALCMISICTVCDSCLFLSGSCVLLKWIQFLQAKAVEVARATLTSFFHPFTIIMVRFFFSQFTFSSFPSFAVMPDWILWERKKNTTLTLYKTEVPLNVVKVLFRSHKRGFICFYYFLTA